MLMSSVYKLISYSLPVFHRYLSPDCASVPRGGKPSVMCRSVAAALVRNLLFPGGRTLDRRYESMMDEEQIRGIANFVSPSAEVADKFANAILDEAAPSSDPGEGLPFGDAHIATERIQEKLNTFESTYCSK